MPNSKKFSSNILLIIESTKIKQNKTVLKNLMLQVTNWEELINLSFAHGVFPFLYKTLKLYTNLIPQEINKTLRLQYMNIVKKNMLMTSELIKIMALLEENKIQVLSLKGPVLSKMAYGDVLSRQYADLDIIVNEEQLYEAVTLLVKNNYTHTNAISLLKNRHYLRVDNDFSFFTKSSVHIELHWKLFREKIGQNKTFQDYFKDAETVDINAYTLKTLSKEMLLTYLCIHGSKHVWERIEWINDIYRLLNKHHVSWEKVLLICKEMQVQRSLYLGLSLCSYFYKINIPEYITDNVKTKHIQMLQNEVFYFLKNDLVNNKNYLIYKQVNYFQSKLLQTKRQKLEHFIFTYFSVTKNDFLAYPLPSYLSWCYYIIKPFRIILKIIFKGK